MITSYSRGHKIFYDGIKWRYADGSLLDDSKPCVKCNEFPTKEGYDPCLGYIEGAISACCGHGVEEPFVVMGSD